MNPTTLYIFLAIFFIAVLIIGFIVANAVDDKQQENKRVHQRLTDIEDELKPGLGISLIRQKYLTSLSPVEQALEALPGMLKLEQIIEQSGRFFPAYRLIMVSLGLGLAASFTAGLYTQQLPVVVLAFALAFWLPIALLKYSRDRRLAKFEEQLPDALDMMVRAMRAGHRFNDTLSLVAYELPDPIGSEFGITFDELNFGVDVRIAFRNLLSRVPSISLMAMVTSVLVQRESGGNLAEILQSISRVVRNRFKFERKVKTLTAEGRASVWVLALMPFGLFILLKITSPNYIDALFIHPLGPKIIGAGLFMMFLGGLWINKMMKIEI